MQHIHLLSNQRSGSTYFYHTLRNYIAPDQQRFINEPFSFHDPFSISHANRYFQHDVISDRIEMLEQADHRFVVKNHYNDLERLRQERYDIYERFKNLDLYTIVLARHDLFEIALSYTIADQTGQWNTYSDIDPITIDEQVFISNLCEMSRRVQGTIANHHGFQIAQIVDYDDLTFVPRKDIQIIDIQDIDTDYDVIINEVERSPDKRYIVTNYDDLQMIARSFLTKSQ